MKAPIRKKELVAYDQLLQHSYYLSVSLNLARNRYVQLSNTMEKLHLSDLKGENLTKIQVKTAKELGGIQAKMWGDAPAEIALYHWGPLQVACCLLDAMIEKYARLIIESTLFKDQKIDKYLKKNDCFIASLKDARDSILHQRYDNSEKQQKFLSEYSRDAKFLSLLDEGESLFKHLLTHVWNLGLKEKYEKEYADTTK